MPNPKTYSRPEFYRLAPDELRARLEALGLDNREFANLTGINAQNVKRWLMPEDAERALEPPFWVSSWLAMAAVPGALQAARDVTEANLIREGSDDAS